MKYLVCRVNEPDMAVHYSRDTKIFAPMGVKKFEIEDGVEASPFLFFQSLIDAESYAGFLAITHPNFEFYVSEVKSISGIETPTVLVKDVTAKGIVPRIS